MVSSDSSKTILLAKYDLKSDGNGSYIQDTSGINTNLTKANLLGTNNSYYWDGKVGSSLAYEGDYCSFNTSNVTNCAYVYDSNAVNIEPVVTSYANKIGNVAGTTIEGKLISLQEAYQLKNSGSDGENAI